MNTKVRVRVTPAARRERFEQRSESEFVAAVRERAERNAANTRVQALVAQHFNVPITSVRFLTGARGRSKLFEVVR